MAATASSRKRSLDTSDAGSPGLRKRDWTVSIALPGSIVSNAQSRELQTHLVGVIARTACIFQIDEVVVFDDGCDAGGKRFNSCEFMARLLQYTETPQYLRKALFPRHPDLKLAGLLPPLDAPHHLRSDEWFTFREGVVLDRPSAGGSIVDVGLRQSASIPQALGSAVSPNAPVREQGVYWGYSVRMATSLSAALTECPWSEGYDLLLGTSERGAERVDDGDFSLPSFKHLLIAFGGVTGLEEAAMSDSTLAAAGITDVQDAFHMYVNTCPFQGSRTIRTEEALAISLATLQPAIKTCQSAASAPKKPRMDA
ncbi:SPOUT1 [Symbiodinium sp. KB8]|nr:SPOUT1 [Symbiodinium sp. KB8]